MPPKQATNFPPIPQNPPTGLNPLGHLPTTYHERIQMWDYFKRHGPGRFPHCPLVDSEGKMGMEFYRQKTRWSMSG
ncbi:hypothetical protein B0A48_18541 [Cryoendolithus antarcticus]|uniref:Uncharacterized protein n=1 Tax=Cryoendolithus antarcticus TaxID=1507870 RepID=A0A1V8S997_9PEZI|nr:hypothetical protein B0A48_18541 [Cryoendolithus antarcticus]